MFKLPIRHWSERSRMLVLMLALVLPAAALIVVSVNHLRSIQREKGVEAVIQRDYQQVLAIAQKRIVDRAYEITEEAKTTFPSIDHPEDLDSYLVTHQDIAHAFLWNDKRKLVFLSQPSRRGDPEFEEEGRRLVVDGRKLV